MRGPVNSVGVVFVVPRDVGQWVLLETEAAGRCRHCAGLQHPIVASWQQRLLRSSFIDLLATHEINVDTDAVAECSVDV